jgi:hypothetical protein
MPVPALEKKLKPGKAVWRKWATLPEHRPSGIVISPTHPPGSGALPSFKGEVSRRKAVEALDWTRGVMSRIGLTLNEAKTHIRQANAEQFDFLGYTFGPHRFRKDGYVFLGDWVERRGPECG